VKTGFVLSLVGHVCRSNELSILLHDTLDHFRVGLFLHLDYADFCYVRR